jgi:DnaJ-class molecular chaperone
MSVSTRITEGIMDKLVKCPSCNGKGSELDADIDLEVVTLGQCDLCQGEGKLEKWYADQYPFK